VTRQLVKSVASSALGEVVALVGENGVEWPVTADLRFHDEARPVGGRPGLRWVGQLAGVTDFLASSGERRIQSTFGAQPLPLPKVSSPVDVVRSIGEVSGQKPSHV
jgi:hypothetical protein